jgi:hypothetical protein
MHLHLILCLCDCVFGAVRGVEDMVAGWRIAGDTGTRGNTQQLCRYRVQDGHPFACIIISHRLSFVRTESSLRYTRQRGSLHLPVFTISAEEKVESVPEKV